MPAGAGSEQASGVSTLEASIVKTKIRLRTLLACQYSFGSTVGAPVIFYTGAFIYTIVDLSTQYGDIDSSNALAFGI